MENSNIINSLCAVTPEDIDVATEYMAKVLKYAIDNDIYPSLELIEKLMNLSLNLLLFNEITGVDQDPGFLLFGLGFFIGVERGDRQNLAKEIFSPESE